MGDPPGGPPDREPPVVSRIAPDSGSTALIPPRDVEVLLSEVVAERVAAPRPDIASAVLLSPVRGQVQVGWHRNRITVRPREGLLPGRVYRLEVFPVLVDLRQNRMRAGRVSVFSTGPAIPDARLEGSAVDWVGARAGAGALVEAVLLPDSLAYRAVTDSSGAFVLAQVPPGEYLVYGTLDQDNNRERGPREAYDTVRVLLADSAVVELYAFPRDTTGPRIRGGVETVDSLTLRVTFDRPLDPAQVLDTSAVWLAPAADSTARLALAAVWTPRQADSARAAAAPRPAADTARARAPADTLRQPSARDSAAARPAQREGARARPDSAAARPPAPLAAPTARPGAGPAPAPRDSSRAQRMLARRPAPSPVRLLRLAAPLPPGARYLVFVTGARSLAGVTADTARGSVSVPRPARRAPRTPADSAAIRADTTRLTPATDTAAARRDTTPPPTPGSRLPLLDEPR